MSTQRYSVTPHPIETFLTPVSQEQRAHHAKIEIGHRFSDKQQTLLDFVLSHYVTVGVEELDTAKLAPLLQLKYGSAHDAVDQLGQRPDEIRNIFNDFQRYFLD